MIVSNVFLTMQNKVHQKIIRELRNDGISFWNVKSLISPKEIVKDFDSLIQTAKVNRPRYTNNSIKTLIKSDLALYHKKMASNDDRIPQDIFEKGEEHYRNDIVHVTVTNPLIDIPKINNVVFSDLIQSIADDYLGGKAAVGYVKLKKSYANNQEFRSTNHKFHFDDNAPKILKVLFYMNDVHEGGGGFQFVRGSHKANHIRNGEKITFEDNEVISMFGSEAIQECIGNAGTCVFADTLGLHKEGIATKMDRYSTIINYVLEPEYGGVGSKQLVSKKTFSSLQMKNKSLARFLEVVEGI